MANTPLAARDSGDRASLGVAVQPGVLLPGVSLALCGPSLTGAALGGSPRAILYCSTGSNSFLIESVLQVVIVNDVPFLLARHTLDTSL